MSAVFKVLSKRIALGLQYDGSSFSGWQSQLSGNTVQDHLEQALTRFIAADNATIPLRVTAAGRTDAGVHALGQVVHVDVTVERDAWSWVRGLNRYLPQAIVVNWAQQVANTFDARFSAYERTYLYALHAGPCRAPTVAQRAGYLMLPAQEWFDVPAMQAAAASLIGEHDFSAFRAAECQSKTPVKHLYEITLLDQEPWLFFKIRANAFLHHMVVIPVTLHGVKELEHMGFWFPHDIFDYSYQTESRFAYRTKHMINSIKQLIANLSIGDMQQYYNDNIDKFHANAKLVHIYINDYIINKEQL